MTTRVWMMSDGQGGLRVNRIEPIDLAGATVTVRRPDVGAPWDGVWINGKRSYDTDVMINGLREYHSPVESVGRACFDRHEQAGGGHSL